MRFSLECRPWAAMDFLYEGEGKGLLIGLSAAEHAPVRFLLKVSATPVTRNGETQHGPSEKHVDGILSTIDGNSIPALQTGQRFRLRFGEADLQVEITSPDGSFVLLQNLGKQGAR